MGPKRRRGEDFYFFIFRERDREEVNKNHKEIRGWDWSGRSGTKALEDEVVISVNFHTG